MVRAVATSHALAEVLDLPLYPWLDLHEEGGLYLDDERTGMQVGQPGPDRSYFAVHYPRLVLPDTLREGGWWNRPYESMDERPVRARRFLKGLLDRHGGTDDRVAVVSHGGFYCWFLTTLLSLTNPGRYWFELNNVAITRIDFESDMTRIAYMNRVDFLPREMVT